MADSLIISPLTNCDLEISAAKVEVEYLLSAVDDKASAEYEACITALKHLDNALSLLKQV
jgi:hypothetical protein